MGVTCNMLYFHNFYRKKYSPFLPSIAYRTYGIFPTHAREPGYRSRYSDWLRAGRQRGRSSSPGGISYILFSTSSRPALGSTQPPSQSVTGVLCRGLKQSGREIDHSPLTTSEVKKMWIYISTPHTPSWRSA
jgi:hypothetical protein